MIACCSSFLPILTTFCQFFARNLFLIYLGSIIYPLSISANFDHFLPIFVRILFLICLGSIIYPSVFLLILTTFCQFFVRNLFLVCLGSVIYPLIFLVIFIPICEMKATVFYQNLNIQPILLFEILDYIQISSEVVVHDLHHKLSKLFQPFWEVYL